jgi:hypothetical protein
MRPVEFPGIWVLGQKKAGTSLAANFISQGVYGRDAAIDLPARRWLQRWLLPRLFRWNPRLAVEAISRIQRRPVVKEPNLCYHVRALTAALDGRAIVVYVTRRRAQHVRSFLDRILERTRAGLAVRPDLNFVWRDYIGELQPGSRVNDAQLEAMISRLAVRFDRTEDSCLEAIGKLQGQSLVIRYEDIIEPRQPSAARGNLLALWPSFDWARASSALKVQHQPRGHQLVDANLIEALLKSGNQWSATGD